MRIGFLLLVLCVCVEVRAQKGELRVSETTLPEAEGELPSRVRTFVSNDGSRMVDSMGSAPFNGFIRQMRSFI